MSKKVERDMIRCGLEIFSVGHSENNTTNLLEEQDILAIPRMTRQKMSRGLDFFEIHGFSGKTPFAPQKFGLSLSKE